MTVDKLELTLSSAPEQNIGLFGERGTVTSRRTGRKLAQRRGRPNCLGNLTRDSTAQPAQVKDKGRRFSAKRHCQGRRLRTVTQTAIRGVIGDEGTETFR